MSFNSVEEVVERIDSKLEFYEASPIDLNDVEYGRYKELKKLRQEVAGKSREKDSTTGDK